MEKQCKYCDETFEPKRVDMEYCSASCRQMAYMARNKKNPASNLLDGLKYINEQPETSIGNEIHYIKPSIRIEKNVNIESEKGSGEGEKPSIDVFTELKKPSINTEKQKEGINTGQKNISITQKAEEKGEYIKVHSSVITELIQLANERGDSNSLAELFWEKCPSTLWVSLRYRCLVECLLTFSEMKSVEPDDLKEVCNALTEIIQSKYFKYLPSKYPYTNEILELKKTLKQICINAEDNEPLKFRLKRATKLNMIATRWDLASFVTKKSFSQLNFKE